MTVWALTLFICLVAVAGTVGGAATRYERHGPPQQRGPAGALAVISLTLALTVALTVFVVATVQTDGVAWRLLGVACAGGLFGGLVAARGVDHYLILHSCAGAMSALLDDAVRGARTVQEVLRPLPWQSIADALSGIRKEAERVDSGRSSQR